MQQNAQPVELLDTTRVGQLTGTTDLDRPEHDRRWPHLVDAEHRPLLTDTGRWGAIGVDLGANTEHQGRLYIFFGDVWTGNSGIPINADLVAWVDEPQVLRHGGHLALGWTFVLPFEPTDQQGQREWRFCGKCGGLFYDGYPDFKGVCHRGGVHAAIGWRFVVPARETGAQAGQPEWRYCGKCAGLFYDGYPQFKGVCPNGGLHEAIGWEFLLPYEPTGVQGQPEWRYCGKCAGLFWDGGAHKGLCQGAPGGGVHLNAVLREDGRFDPFTASDPVGETLSLETPNGAFSYAGKVWVFAGFGDARYTGHRRPGDPAPGCYLTSKERPDLPGFYTTEFLFTPRIGWCPRDSTRDRLESHTPLGYKFFLSHSSPEGPNRQANYRFCGKCAALFWDGDPTSSHCHGGGRHEAAGLNYVVSHSMPEDAQHQANWRRCQKCASVFWNGDPANSGLCPAGGLHHATPRDLLLAHPSLEEDATHQANWRYCGKCFALFFDGYAQKGVCPKDRAGHSAIGFDFVLPHDVDENAERQRHWRYCGKCFGLFYDGYAEKGVCPNDGGAHSAIGHNFVLPHDTGETAETQRHWRYCGKCFALFYDGYTEKGVCPKDGAGHSAIGFNFVLPHNPAVDATTQGRWDWSDEIKLFNPIAQGAYGKYMHKVGSPNRIHPDIPPSQDPAKPEHDGWAYGAFLLNRYTEWDATTRELGIYYLLSLSSPYQVQLMHSRLRLG